MSSPRGRSLRGRLNIDPDAPEPVRVVPALAPEPAVTPVPDPEPSAEEAPSEPPVAAGELSEAASTTSTRRPRKPRPKAPQVIPATEDPHFQPPEKLDYRSFYVPNEAYARYRAAIYWSSRNPAAIGEAATNMSQEMTEHMLAVAEDLERRFNGGDVFPAPPPPKPRKRRQ